MSARWPRDDAKLERVRALMAEHALDALVVRAPDNVLYLTNFWGMKGYDACVFPREGEPVLICLEASEEDAAETAWASRRAPRARVRVGRPAAGARAHARRGARGLEGLRPRRPGAVDGHAGVGPHGRRADDLHERLVFRMARRGGCDARAQRRPSEKTAQEIERVRIANAIAADAMEHVRGRLEPGMKESEAAAIWQGFVHGQGTARDDVSLALPFSLVWAGRGIKTFTATSDLPVTADEPVLFEIWVCADGYWADHTKNLVTGELREDYRELEAGLLDVYGRAVAHCVPGASLAELDVLVRDGIDELGYPEQPSHPICHGVGARAHEPPYAHQAGGGTVTEGMVLAIEPGCYWQGGGGLRVEDNFLITADGAEKLSSFPDGVVSCTS